MHLFLPALLLLLFYNCSAQVTDSACTRHYKNGMGFYKDGLALVNEPSDPHAGEKAQKKFRKAVPFLRRCDSLCPGDTNVLTALTGIYYALNEKRLYSKFKNALDSVKTAYVAKALAENWVRLMFDGNHPDSLMLISGVPFSWDNSDVIVTADSLQRAYKQVFQKKGKDRAFITESVEMGPPKNDPGDFARSIPFHFRISHDGKTRSIHVFVRVSNKPHVAGFRD